MAKRPGWERLPPGWTEDSFKSFWNKITEENPEHPFTSCVDKLTGKVDDPEGLCAAAKDRALGTTYWRGPSNKKAKKETTMSLRDYILTQEERNPGALRKAAQDMGVVAPTTTKRASLRIPRERAVEVLMNTLPEYLANIPDSQLEFLYRQVTTWKKSKAAERPQTRIERLEAAHLEMESLPDVVEGGAQGPLSLLREEFMRNKDKPLRVGEEKQGDHLRVHRYRDHFQVTDLTNAGKRGAKVDVLNINCEAVRDESLIDDLGSALLSVDMKRAQEWARSLRKVDRSIKTRVYQVRGVDVSAPAEESIRWSNGALGVIVNHNTAMIRNVKDTANGTTIVPVNTSRGTESAQSRKKLSKWIRDNMSALQKMSFDQVVKALRQAKVKHTFQYI